MKSVAIIGAGPAGLVAAKTLIHSHPGKFSVTVFEHGKSVGGLWAVQNSNNNGAKDLINPLMTTNLSQFTVTFSDLSWASLDIQPTPHIYPTASQVNQYLDCYARKYIPKDCVKFQREVKKVEKIKSGDNDIWRLIVRDLEENVNGNIKKEEVFEFDYLIVASGLFAKGKDLGEKVDIQDGVRVIHSSKYRELSDLTAGGDIPRSGKILIVGGSHSGAEIAAVIALQLSDLSYHINGHSTEPLQIVQVMPHPLVAIPTFVQTVPPKEITYPSFLSLDSLLYNLASRSEDPVQFKYSHTSAEKTKGLIAILKKIMDGEIEEEGDKKVGEPKAQGTTGKEDKDKDLVSPYAVVSDSYVEWVRSGAILPIVGRVAKLEEQNRNEDTGIKKQGLWRAKITSSSGESQVEDIAAIINATGFSSSPALSFMPEEILETFEYNASFPRLPLLFHRDALTSTDAAPKNLALMGFLDGSYWGVLETQARVIANKWNHIEDSKYSEATPKTTRLHSHLQQIRAIMADDPSKIPQNFFGDYQGLLEEASRDLGLNRIDLKWKVKEGMVTPARYIDKGCDASEAEKTMVILQQLMDIESNSHAFAAKATFRALQGKWVIRSKKAGDTETEVLSTTASFHPRLPSNGAVDSEYLFIPSEKSSLDLTKLLYRLKAKENKMEIWSVSEGNTAGDILHIIEFNTASSDKKNCLTIAVKSSTGFHIAATYSFWFTGVHISKFSTQRFSDDKPFSCLDILDFSRSSSGSL